MANVWGRVRCSIGRFGPNSAEKEEVECSTSPFSVGRSRECTLRVTSSKCVSSRHCVLTFNAERGQVMLEDVSSNGTLLNKTKLVKGMPVPIRPGDTVVLVQKREDPNQNLSFQFLSSADEDLDATLDGALDSQDTQVTDPASELPTKPTQGQKRKAEESVDDDTASSKPSAKRPASVGASGNTVAAAAVAAAATAATAAGGGPATAAPAAPSDAAAANAMSESMTCSICQDMFHDCVSLQPCLHAFCAGCYSPWMKKSKQCPQCRKAVVAVSKNHIVNNLVHCFLAQHPDRRRDPADTAELDALNTIREDTIQVGKRSSRRIFGLDDVSDMDEDDDDDDDDEDDYSGSDDYSIPSSDEDDDGHLHGAVIHLAHTSVFNAVRASPFNTFPAQRLCRQCPGYPGPHRITRSAPAAAAAIAVAGATAAAGNAGAQAVAVLPPPDTNAAALACQGATAAATTTAAPTAAAAAPVAALVDPSLQVSATVQGFQCGPYTRHLLCHCCHDTMPDRRHERGGAQAAPPQECELCKTFYCHQYWTCKGSSFMGATCRGCLQQFQQAQFGLATLVNKNVTESKILADYLRAGGKEVHDLLTECMKKLDDGVYVTQASVAGRLKSDTIICNRCANLNFSELAYQYRRDIPREALPVAVRSRPDCHWGQECRTQWSKPHHAERFNHICVRTRFD